MTGTLIQSTALKDILTGILFCMLIITIMVLLPLVGIFAWVFLPLPVLFYRLKTGRNGGGIIGAISLILLIIFTRNIAFNAIYFGSLLMTGFFLGEFIEKHYSVEKIVIYTSLAVLGTCLIVMSLYFLPQNDSIGTVISDYITQYQALSSQIFSQSAQQYPELKLDGEMIKRLNAVFIVIFPSIFINSFLTMIWLNILSIKKLLATKGIVVKSIENLNQWKAPDYLILGVIAASVLTFLPVDIVRYFAINCLIILLFVYFFQGISVVSFFFEKKRVPFAIKLFVYVLVAIQPFFMSLVIGLGLFDTWFNFRKLDTALVIKN